MRPRAALVGLGAAVATTLVAPNAAYADVYSDPPPTCSATPSTVSGGQSVTVVGSGFQPASQISVRASGSGTTSSPTLTSDSNGTASGTEGTASSAGQATYTLTGVGPHGAASSCSAAVSTTIPSAAPASPASPGAPRVPRVRAIARTRTQPLGVPKVAIVGQPFVVHACGYVPGSTVQISDGSGAAIGSAVAASNGCFMRSITVDHVGSTTLNAVGAGADGSRLISTATVPVRAIKVLGVSVSSDPAAATPAGGRLPFTGADDVGLLVFGGLLLVAAGSGLVGGARRRGRAAASSV